MENFFNPILSEEQIAAYLDGMLSTEECKTVEELITSNPEMEEIQEVIDSVDSTYIYKSDIELPIECLADDFFLPFMDVDIDQSDDVYHTDNHNIEEYDVVDNFHDDMNEWDSSDEISGIENDDFFPDNGHEDYIF